MDFSHSARSNRLLDQLRDFVETRVTPAVAMVTGERADNPGVAPVTTDRLIAEAKDAGLWNLCVRHPDYGPGLLFTEYAQLAEFMGAHPLAQEVTNCDAPSNINGDAMIAYGSPEQKGRWLEPQLDGQIKSAFAMTEPAVASSDAGNIATTAVKDRDHWILNGRKWYVSGVLHPKCTFMMTVANTAGDGPPHGRHTQFIVPVDAAGVTVVRNLPKFGYLDEDGHVELTLEDVRVPDANVLGEIGGGFAIGQARLRRLVEMFPGVACDDHRDIAADPETGAPGNPRVFAGGDARNGGKEVVNAVAEGQNAARSIDALLMQRDARGGLRA